MSGSPSTYLECMRCLLKKMSYTKMLDFGAILSAEQKTPPYGEDFELVAPLNRSNECGVGAPTIRGGNTGCGHGAPTIKGGLTQGLNPPVPLGRKKKPCQKKTKSQDPESTDINSSTSQKQENMKFEPVNYQTLELSSKMYDFLKEICDKSKRMKNRIMSPKRTLVNDKSEIIELCSLDNYTYKSNYKKYK